MRNTQKLAGKGIERARNNLSPLYYVKAKEFLKDVLLKGGSNLDKMCTSFQLWNDKCCGNDQEKKLTVDSVFRECVVELNPTKVTSEKYLMFVELSVMLAKQDICPPSTPILVLTDILDVNSLEFTSDIFSYVEKNVEVWKSPMFHSPCKNFLLRMCNDLLRRLSKSQDTLYSGRIQLFLARLFPLSEKSGLNLMSQFHVDNVTKFCRDPIEFEKIAKANLAFVKEESMDVEDGEMKDSSSSIPVDYNLYKKFWSLQDFFRQPYIAYDKRMWLQLINNAEQVFTCFASYKLGNSNSKNYASQGKKFFAKYLTSQKLLDLQLQDGTFRKYVLCQFLIFFQYLQANIKFKMNNHVLTEEQESWVKAKSETVYELIREIPPDGLLFAKCIEHLLDREDNWNDWKNSGCQSYERPQGVLQPFIKTRKRTLGEDMKLQGTKLTKMGNSELTRLWNLEPDNMVACRNAKRQRVPDHKEFVAEAIEQNDPVNDITECYKLIHNDNWSWKAVRLLSRQSNHFYSPANPILSHTLDKSLARILKSIEKETKGTVSCHMEQEEIKAVMKSEEEDMKEDDRDREDSSNNNLPDKISKLTPLIGADWRKLAAELNITDIPTVEDDEDTEVLARAMLDSWMKQEKDVSVEALMSALNEIGQEELTVALND